MNAMDGLAVPKLQEPRDLPCTAGACWTEHRTVWQLATTDVSVGPVGGCRRTIQWVDFRPKDLSVRLGKGPPGRPTKGCGVGNHLELPDYNEKLVEQHIWSIVQKQIKIKGQKIKVILIDQVHSPIDRDPLYLYTGKIYPSVVPKYITKNQPEINMKFVSSILASAKTTDTVQCNTTSKHHMVSSS